jgi:chemotaxis protein MotB
MARMLKWLGLATLSFALTTSLTGCVAQEKYNAKALENSALTEQLNDAQKDAATAKAEADAYKSQLDQLQNQLTTEDGIRTNLESQNKDLASQVAELDAKYKDIMNNPPKIEQIVENGGTALPAPLSNALSEFAAANPGVVEFDAARGVVKFKSDVTFATGSADVTPAARSVIDKFAAILNSPAAAEYELLVAGHTDNVPVTNPETIRHGHLNNWYLSAHRAISVGVELVSQGVSKSRLGVVGYADQRPIADNSSAEGRRQNRRVEVLILPTRRSASAVPVAATEKRPVRQSAELNKDSAAAEAQPELNK